MGASTKPFYDSIFWVEVEKIRPNPFQPRRDFDEERLRELAESVRQYGILQPLVVTRKDIELPDGSIRVEYELIAGERRWRAAKIAGLSQVPVVIRSQEESDKMKLELAIIENLQREDLNPVDRALAFKKLQEHGYNNAEIARKIGKSREYVANTLRILNLPEEILEALRKKQITEGFTRPLLMLNDRPEEQQTLFREILERRLSVRETERIARRIAKEKIRRKLPPEVSSAEAMLARALGTRVMVTPRPSGKGGKIVIDYFSEEDLQALLAKLAAAKEEAASPTTLSPAAPQQQAPQGQRVVPPRGGFASETRSTATSLNPPQAHTQPTSSAPTADPHLSEPSSPPALPAPASQPNGATPPTSLPSTPVPPSPFEAGAEAAVLPPQSPQPPAHSTQPSHVAQPTIPATPPQQHDAARNPTPPGSPSPTSSPQSTQTPPAGITPSPLPETTTQPAEAPEEDDGDLYAVHRFTI